MLLCSHSSSISRGTLENGACVVCQEKSKERRWWVNAHQEPRCPQSWHHQTPCPSPGRTGNFESASHLPDGVKHNTKYQLTVVNKVSKNRAAAQNLVQESHVVRVCIAVPFIEVPPTHAILVSAPADAHAMQLSQEAATIVANSTKQVAATRGKRSNWDSLHPGMHKQRRHHHVPKHTGNSSVVRFSLRLQQGQRLGQRLMTAPQKHSTKASQQQHKRKSVICS